MPKKTHARAQKSSKTKPKEVSKSVKPKEKAKPKQLLSKAAAKPKVSEPEKKQVEPKVTKSPGGQPKAKGKRLNTAASDYEILRNKVAAEKAGKAKKGEQSVFTKLGARSSSPICREVACELLSTTGGYCRMHYIKNWKKIKRKELILKEKKLNSYIEELVSKYPDKYIEALRQDLASEKEFAKVIADLEIEEPADDFDEIETESAEGIIDNIKREFDDDTEVF